MPNTLDKVVAITGASSGIGEATARLLAERGAAVVLGARRTDRLDVLAREIREHGGRAVAVATDVTRREDVESLVGTAVAEFGRLDVFVGNAGVAALGPTDDLDTDAWATMIDVNLRGVLNGVAAALPVFRRQGRGHLVTTLSTAGIKIVPAMGVYAGTKNAARTLLEALRQESTDGVLRTTSISPGYIQTELAGGGMPEFALSPTAVARAIAFAIEQPHEVEIGEITLRPTVQN